MIIGNDFHDTTLMTPYVLQPAMYRTTGQNHPAKFLERIKKKNDFYKKLYRVVLECSMGWDHSAGISLIFF